MATGTFDARYMDWPMAFAEDTTERAAIQQSNNRQGPRLLDLSSPPVVIRGDRREKGDPDEELSQFNLKFMAKAARK